MPDPQAFDVPTSMPTSMPALPGKEEIAERLRELWQFLTTAHASDPPPLSDFLTGLAAIPWIEGVLLALFGMIYLIWGERIFKVLVILNAAFLGGIIGGMVSVNLGYQDSYWIGMLVGAGVLGLLSWPLVKLFVAVCGGIVGAGVGFVAFADIVCAMGRNDLAGYSWIGAAIGAAALGLVALLLFRAGIMLFTSLQGATMVVCGLLCLVFKIPTMGDPVREALLGNPHAMPIATSALALVGLMLQVLRWSRWKRANAAIQSKSDQQAKAG